MPHLLQRVGVLTLSNRFARAADPSLSAPASQQIVAVAGATQAPSLASKESNPEGKSSKDRMDSHMAFKSDNYDREWRHFLRWLNETPEKIEPSGGWLVKSNKDSFPPFTKVLLREYASWLLDEYHKGSLAHTQAAVNHFYSEAGIAAPWIGRSFHRIMGKYVDARKELAIENGEFEKGQTPAGCRVPVPEDVLVWLLAFAENLEPEDPRLAKVTIILIGFVFLLRASSLYFEKGDVAFVKDGDGNDVTLVVQSVCVKTLDSATKHQLRCPGPNPKFGPKHPRARFFGVVRKALDNGGLCCISSSAAASTTVTKWMAEIIPASVSSLVKGHKITSHSLRKAGASAMATLAIDFRGQIMPWGRWRTAASAEKYAQVGYVVTTFSGGMFSWKLGPLSPFRWTAVTAFDDL